MSNAGRSEVRLIISGTAVGLEQALAEAQKSLAGFGAAATKAGAQAGTTLAQGEARAGHEAQSMGARVRVAADMVGLLGIESGESSAKVFLLRDALGELGHSFGGIRGAILGGIGAMAAFGALDFMKESVGAAMEGERATAAYNEALGKTPGLLASANKSLEEHRAQFTQLGIDDSDVMAMMARASGKGLDPRLITEHASAFADLAVVLKTDFGGAVESVTRGQRGLNQVMTRLNLSAMQQRQLMAQMRGASPEQRASAILALVEQSSYAGAATAQAGTAEGKFKAFHTAVHNLQEEVGTALIPALTQLATALTSMLQAADAMARPFGGLAQVLKVLFLPMLAGGLLLFTNLRGVLTGMVDLLLGRVVGAFSQTATSLAEADAGARELAADLDAIKPTVATLAHFDAAAAMAAKDAYIANIERLKAMSPVTTTGVFVPAKVSTPVGVPVPLVATVDERQVATARAQIIRDLGTVPVPVQPELAGTLKQQTAEAARLRATLEREIGTINVQARAHWAADAASGLKTGLGLGVGVAIADAIFNSVTIKHLDAPKVLVPAVVPTTTGAPPAGAQQTVRISGTPHVHVENIGALGEALVTKVPHSVTVSGHPYVGIVPNQSVGLAGVPTVKISSTTPIQTTTTLPSTINVHAQQSGGWQVSLAPDAFARFGEMVAEVAVGTMLANLLSNFIGKIPFGKILDVLKNLFKGKGKGGGANEEPAIPLLPQWSQSTAAQMVEDMLKGSAGVPLERSLVPVGAGAGAGAGGKATSTFIMTGLMDGLRGVDWGAVARFMVGGWALAVGGWLLAGVGKTLFGSPQLAGAETLAEAKKAGLTSAQAKAYVQHTNKAILAAHSQSTAGFGAIAGAILGGIKTAILTGLTGLLNGIIGLFNSVISKLPLGLGKHLEIPLLKPPPGPHGSILSGALAGGKSGLHTLAPGAVAHLSSLLSGALGTTGGAGAAAAHHTTTLHATINVNGAQDPHRVAQEVNHALADFMGGVKASRRLHG